MTEKILEAQLVVSARDRTAAGIAKTVKNIDSAINSVERFRAAQSQFKEARANFQNAQKAVESAAKAMKTAVQPTRQLERPIKARSRPSPGPRARSRRRRRPCSAPSANLKVTASCLAAAGEETRLKNASAAATQAMNRQEERAARLRRRPDTLGSRIGGLVGPLAAGYAAYESAHVVRSVSEKAAHAAVQGQHERVRLEAAGMTPAEIKDAEDVSAKLSAIYKPLSQTTLLHMLRNVRSIVGSYEEGAKLIEPVAKLRIIAMGAHPERAEELESDFDKLLKSQEMVGATQDIPRFTSNMNLMAKALNVFGDTLKPEEFYNFAKYARQAGQAYSDRFLLAVAPTLMQDMGGKSAGEAMASFYQQFVGGKMTKPAARMLIKYGLLDESKIEFTKAGLPSRILPGALKDSDLAKKNPDLSIHEVLLPALAAAGITAKEDIENVGAVLASKRTTGQALGIFATQWARIQKDLAMEKGAKGLEAADVFMNKDVTLGLKSVAEQLQNFLQAAGSPLAPAAARHLNELAGSIGHLTEAAREHPTAASTGLVATVAGMGLAAYESAILAAGKFGMLSEAMAHTLARAPLTVLGSGAVPLGVGGFGTVEFLREQEARNQSGKPVDRDVIAALPWYRRAAIWTQENIFGADPNRLVPELMGPAWPAAGAPFAPGIWPSAEPAKAELTGDATVTVKIDGPDWLKSMVSVGVNNRIEGLTIGTAESPGASMPEAAPIPYLTSAR